jgi:hypothetical protein
MDREGMHIGNTENIQEIVKGKLILEKVTGGRKTEMETYTLFCLKCDFLLVTNSS